MKITKGPTISSLSTFTIINILNQTEITAKIHLQKSSTHLRFILLSFKQGKEIDKSKATFDGANNPDCKNMLITVTSI